MDLGFEEHGSNMKRKRGRGKRKPFVHEKVEVRSLEDGFLGSWHSGTIIACHQQERFVKYDHILNEDGSDNLVDIVDVSPIVDGISCINKKWRKSRGYIRPVPPPLLVAKWDLTYGLCVDVYHQEAWWEGVIFDHQAGVEERRIFFPDLGHEMTVGIDSLRITQDWDESTETWDCRGPWLLLEIIEECEEEQYIPVSVKQIWYDLQEKKGLQRVGDWTSSRRALWEDLVLQVINDNIKITLNFFLRELALPGSFQQESQPLLEASEQSSTGVNLYHEADLAQSRAVVVAENPLGTGAMNPNSADFQPPQKNTDLHLKRNILPELNGSGHDKAVSLKPKALPVLHPITDRISDISCTTNGDRFCCIKSSMVKRNFGSRGIRKSGNWLRVTSNLAPGAEFCANAVTAYALSDSKQQRNSLKVGVRKYLKYLGWTIESTKNASGTPRLRYTSPDGNCYYSLIKVCLNLMKGASTEIPSLNSQAEKSNLPTSLIDSPTPLLDHASENRAPGSCPLSRASSRSSVLLLKGEYCPQAVMAWGKIEVKESRKKHSENKMMILKARKHLLALGWVFSYREVSGKRVLMYKSPRGKFFLSLREACKACLQEGEFEGGASTCTLVGNVNPREEEEIQEKLANDNSPSAICNEEIQKSLVHSEFLLKPWSIESSHNSQSTKFVNYDAVKVQGIPKLGRKRKRNSLHLAQCLAQKQASLHAQNDSLLKPEVGKTSGALIKSRNDLEVTRCNCVLRSSKRVQQTSTPNSSHRNPQTVLSWLIDNNVLLPGAKVQYRTRKDWCSTAQGRITRLWVRMQLLQEGLYS